MPSADPRDWTPADVEEFARDADPDELEQVFRHPLVNPDEQAVRVIEAFLGARNRDVWLKFGPRFGSPSQHRMNS